MPLGLDAALADSAAAHFIHGRAQSGAELPEGYRVVWRTAHRPGGTRLQAALFAPSPGGPARVCTARFTGTFAVPGAARILAAAARYSPALADSPDVCPRPAKIAPLLRYGHAELTPEPGLLVHYGPLTVWLHRRRLQLAAGPGSRLVLAVDGACDAYGTARLTDHVLREAGGGHRFARDVGGQLPAGARAVADQWHPQAAVVFLTAPADLDTDPLGRGHDRRYRALGRALAEQQPAWQVQSLTSDEGSAVALRVTETAAVPDLFKHAVWTLDPPGSPDAGGSITSEFRPCRRGCPHHQREYNYP
ncbi:hypothetical protein [Streptomyces sp. NPDC046925]|uniref:hypothetical protein n=1 Tax=Streptomyces sp. NPDC046925 TaxID=3155375 RepID=UPI0033E5E06C